jgi:hypothetical protein
MYSVKSSLRSRHIQSEAIGTQSDETHETEGIEEGEQKPNAFHREPALKPPFSRKRKRERATVRSESKKKQKTPMKRKKKKGEETS